MPARSEFSAPGADWDNCDHEVWDEDDSYDELELAALCDMPRALAELEVRRPFPMSCSHATLIASCSLEWRFVSRTWRDSQRARTPFSWRSAARAQLARAAEAVRNAKLDAMWAEGGPSTLMVHALA